MDLGQFDRAAQKAATAVVLHATEQIRTVALDAYSEVIRHALTNGGASGSPVASGRFAASTRVALNSIDHSFAPRDPSYRYPPGKGPRKLPPRTIPNTPISRIAAKLRTFKLGDTIWLSNSVPYSRRIEIGRHSWQTPDGVFDRTMRLVVRRFANISLKVTTI